MNTDASLRSSDLVEVRSPKEISATLDAAGTLDGLPFMPEMLSACGQRFRILRRAEKACVEFAGGEYKIRQFPRDDLVLLEGSRCSGASHDGCQRGCLVFWSTAWLRKVEGIQPAKPPALNDREALGSKLKTTTEPGRYFCQSTEIARITRAKTRLGILTRCIRDVRSGSRGVLEMARLIASPIWRKVSSRIIDRSITGNQTKTPVGTLNLQPGEEVGLKSPQEIAQTLDAKGRNRGLLVDANAVRKFSGGRYRVRTRIDRMINEATGQMCTLNNTVVLENVSCTCHSVVGGCPREDPVFWREIWLKRITKDTTDRNGALAENQSAQPEQTSHDSSANASSRPVI